MRVYAKVLFQALLDLVGDGYGLAFVGAAGDEEKVGEAGIHGIELEDAGVDCLFVFACGGGGQNHAAGLSGWHSVRVILLCPW
jgi:hypothetical protein